MALRLLLGYCIKESYQAESNVNYLSQEETTYACELNTAEKILEDRNTSTLEAFPM